MLLRNVFKKIKYPDIFTKDAIPDASITWAMLTENYKRNTSPKPKIDWLWIGLGLPELCGFKLSHYILYPTGDDKYYMVGMVLNKQNKVVYVSGNNISLYIFDVSRYLGGIKLALAFRTGYTVDDVDIAHDVICGIGNSKFTRLCRGIYRDLYGT